MSGYASSSAAAAAPAHDVTPSQVLGSEESIVDDITTPSGLRPLPDASDLRRFVEAASTMDGLRLAELLRAKMEAPGGWQAGLRALCALEAVLQRGSSQACGEVAVMFQSEPTHIQALATSQQQLVREVAGRCLRLLLGDDAVPTEVAAAGGGKKGGGKPYAAAPPPAQDLLSLDDDPPAAGGAQASSSSAAAAAVAVGVDLLADLAGPPVPAVPAAAAADSLFSGLDVGSTSSVPAAAPAAADDLFGGLSLAAAPPPTSTPPPAAAASAAAAPLLDDLFSGLGVSSGPQTVAAPMFQQQQQWTQQQQQWTQQQPQLGVPTIKVGGPPVNNSTTLLGGGAQARVLSQGGGGSGGNTFSPSAAAAAAAQQPWTGGMTKTMNAFDFVLDEFKKT